MALRRPQTMAEEWKSLTRVGVGVDVDVVDGGSEKKNSATEFFLRKFAAADRADEAALQQHCPLSDATAALRGEAKGDDGARKRTSIGPALLEL